MSVCICLLVSTLLFTEFAFQNTIFRWFVALLTFLICPSDLRALQFLSFIAHRKSVFVAELGSWLRLSFFCFVFVFLHRFLVEFFGLTHLFWLDRCFWAQLRRLWFRIYLTIISLTTFYTLVLGITISLNRHSDTAGSDYTVLSLACFLNVLVH